MRLRGSFNIAVIVLGLCLSSLSLSFAEEKKDPNDPYSNYQPAPFTASLSADSEGTIAGAWKIATDASSVIVAVIDTGVDLNHPDLIRNLWVNKGEIPGNGIDDDKNGFVDDINGYDFKHREGVPEDEWGHGTLSAGIIGAVGNNGIGTAGVAWSVQLMILKVFGDSGTGKVEDFAAAIRYAIQNGARIINAGWTIPASYPGDQVSDLMDAVQEAREAGVLIVAAAGNDSADLDETPVFPASYPFDNVVSVAALGKSSSKLLGISNFGEGEVTVAISGEEIVAPYLDGNYATLTGTSASTAVVTGIAALMVSSRPEITASTIRKIFMETSDPAEFLQGEVSSGGILNPRASLAEVLVVEPTHTTDTTTDTAGTERDSSGAGGCSLVP